MIRVIILRKLWSSLPFLSWITVGLFLLGAGNSCPAFAPDWSSPHSGSMPPVKTKEMPSQEHLGMLYFVKKITIIIILSWNALLRALIGEITQASPKYHFIYSFMLCSGCPITGTGMLIPLLKAASPTAAFLGKPENAGCRRWVVISRKRWSVREMVWFGC